MPERLRFCFELDAVEDVRPWGEPGQQRLHWFGLTSGRYWLETAAGEALTYTIEAQQLWELPSAHVDYQVARWLEDIQECLPAILEPVPVDIADIVSDSEWLSRAANWREAETEEQEMYARWDLYDDAARWWHDREISTAYLRHGPRFWCWRIEDDIHLRWKVENNREGDVPVFLVPRSYCRINATEFQTAACNFCEEVLSAMQRRVEQIRQEGWRRTDCSVDVSELVREQQQREIFFSGLRNQCCATDWDRVRLHLNLLRQKMEEGGAS